MKFWQAINKISKKDKKNVDFIKTRLYIYRITMIFYHKTIEGTFKMADHRYVVIDNAAVKRAETYIDTTKRDKGIRLSIGTVFAMALDKMLENEKTEPGTGV